MNDKNIFNLKNFDNPNVSIVIPAHNEIHRLPKTLAKLSDFLTSFSLKTEIIIVNDGSDDGTLNLLQNWKPQLKIINNNTRQGKGKSVKKGILAAHGDYVFFMDADMSVPISYLEHALKELQNKNDVVIGSRRISGASIVVHQSFLREKLGQSFNIIIKLLRLTDFNDTQCGFKGFKKNAAEKIFSNQRTEKFAFDVEILYLANLFGYKIKEIPIKWYNSAESKVIPILDPFLMLIDILKIRFYSWFGFYQ